MVEQVRTDRKFPLQATVAVYASQDLTVAGRFAPLAIEKTVEAPIATCIDQYGLDVLAVIQRNRVDCATG